MKIDRDVLESRSFPATNIDKPIYVEPAMYGNNEHEKQAVYQQQHSAKVTVGVGSLENPEQRLGAHAAKWVLACHFLLLLYLD